MVEVRPRDDPPYGDTVAAETFVLSAIGTWLTKNFGREDLRMAVGSISKYAQATCQSHADPNSRVQEEVERLLERLAKSMT